MPILAATLVVCSAIGVALVLASVAFGKTPVTYSAGRTSAVATRGGELVSGAERQVSRHTARAVAAAINLRRGDLPTLKQGPSPTPGEVQQDAQIAAALARCYGGPPYSDVLADVASPPFLGGSGSSAGFIASETEIFPSAALASDDIDAGSKPGGIACILSAWRAVMSPSAPAGQVLRGHAVNIASVVAGTGIPFATRMTFTASPSASSNANPTIVGRVDLFGFVRGQAEVQLTVQTDGAVPAASTERRLVTLLVARAGTAIG
ncbi:MAG TPA: hypothetical protein VHY18_13470 [Solirubrobacteraceae bacterium]|jgi:hypothetical protein|nr:hypothetical protein [Solirubrobacteraceae bacterium]